MNYYLIQALKEIESGNFEEAHKLCRSAMEGTGAISEAYKILGAVYLRQQKIIEAIACLESSYALDETNFQAGELLSQAYERANRPREAVELNKHRLRYFPSNVDITRKVINYYQQNGIFEQKNQDIRSAVEKHTAANPNKSKRVLFGMSFTIYPPCEVHDFLLSQALILRGAEIIPLICGMAQEGECNVFGGIWGGMTGNPEHDRTKCLNNCQTCMEADNKLWREWAGIEPVAVSKYISPFQREETRRLVAQMDLSKYRTVVLDGMPIGRWASDVIRNNYMVGDDSLVPDLTGQVRHFFFNILLMVEGCRQALQDIRPDVIVSNDSYYYQWAILEELARQHKIPFYSHWQGGRRMGWCYAYNEPAMELRLGRYWYSFKEIPLLPFEERIADDFLKARPTGGTMTLNTADPSKNNDIQAIEQIDFSKPTVLLAANVIWDLAVLNREVQFKDMIDWACQTIEFFREQPDWQLIIKPHPVELNKNLPATRQLLAEEIIKRIPQLPPNVVVCSPLTNLSVYDLIPHVRFGLIFTSTVGLEMACQGMAVVTGGVSVYHNMGFTFDPPTAHDYFDTLRTLMSTPELTAYNRERAILARKFLYLYLFRYYTALNLFDHSFTDHPTLLIHDAHELMPGANDVLDYVCDAILAHQSIVSVDRLPPLGRTKRGLYDFTLQETTAATRLVINGYTGNVHEEIIEESDGIQSVKLADAVYCVPKGIFKPGELSWIYEEVIQPFDVNPHAYESNSVAIQPGDVVVDAGACAGFFTRQALAKGAQKVFAFEPLPAIAGALQVTFRQECADGTVVVMPIALTNISGYASFNDGEQFVCEARLTLEGQHIVSTLTLDDFVRSQSVERIDFIKMDIEGEEMNAVTGAIETINRFKPRLAIAVYHQYENAALVRDILLANCPGFTVEFGGRYMFEVPHRPYMLYAYFSEKTKILFTTPVIEHPPASGPALRIENSIKALNQVSELHLVVRIDQEELGGLTAEKFYRQHSHAFVYTPCLGGANNPEDEVQNARAVVRYAEEHGIKIIWCGFGNISYWFMKTVKELNPELKVVCDTDSVWSRFVLRELPLEKSPERRRQIERDGLVKEREEAEWVKFCDVTTAVSEVDAAYYRYLADEPSRIHQFSNVIDLDTYVNPPMPATDMRSPSIYLSGTFYSDTSPMVRAARWVITEVMPVIQETLPNITLFIIGNGADRMLSDILHPNVIIKGKVPSVLPYLCYTDVAVVPLMFESGTRFKILEAAACNIPIVSTSLGAEGLPVEHGVELLIAEEANDFANAIVHLICNKNYAKYLASNCRRLVTRSFSIQSLAEEAQAIIQYLVKKNYRRYEYSNTKNSGIKNKSIQIDKQTHDFQDYAVNFSKIDLVKNGEDDYGFRYELEYFDYICDLPFTYIEVGLNSDVSFCCYINKYIGNLRNDTIMNVWNSSFAQQVRKSILDGTFTYCDKTRCARMQEFNLYKKKSNKNNYLDNIIESRKFYLDNGPQIIALCNDRTCNLECPSCRNNFYSMSAIEYQKAKIDQELLLAETMKDLKVLHLSGSGDPFASKLHRELLQNINPINFPDLKIRIMTNGLLLKQFWDSLYKIHDRIELIGVSVDAATEETYSLVRKGGNFKCILDNLSFISSLSQRKKGMKFAIGMIVQKKNYREMKLFIELGKKLGADSIGFSKLSNWGTFTDSEYLSEAVFLDIHPEHNELIEIMKDPIFRDEKVTLGNLTDLLKMAACHN